LEALFDVNQIREAFKKTLNQLWIESGVAAGPDFIQDVT